MALDLTPLRNRFRTWELLSLIAGMITVFASLFLTVSPEIFRPNPSDFTVSRIDRLESNLAQTSDDLSKLKEQIKSLSSVPDNTKVAIQLTTINATVTDLQARHSKLESAILENPTKAIEVPLLRKDLDNLKDAQQQNMAALKQGVDQVYDLNKWLLGAMAISIVTLAVSNLLKGREKEKAAT
jgi:regulator of replication initiation timing